ncbi:hypothetical protein L2E82_00757 [Cichorium intybus]|uniref:Uncharacterized protein n=1 Tax=Cichorium intybus TaxID=13427 RepID=A0ACB9GWX7_CICIN|nr:hypothetical protein L2E82_00757 [Cichorium intybus]
MREYEAVAGLLEKDLIRIYNEDHEISYEVKEHGTDVAVDPVILRGLVETLELTEGIDIENESRALKEMVTNCGGDPGESIEKMLTTYERTSIEKWMQAGNDVCPKTRQILANKTLIPNFALICSLITQWCETNGMNPRKEASPTTSTCTPVEYSLINRCIQQLKSNDVHHSRTGAGEICLLSRRNSEVRVAIGEAGAIPLLSKLLLETRDPLTQEHCIDSSS